MNTVKKQRRFGRLATIVSLTSVLVAAAFVTAGASAQSAATPQSTSQPAISGQVREGRTLTASNGSWNNSPTSFSYQWQQCDMSGANCNPIAGATSKTYVAASSDVDHTLRVAVTATNSDGSSSSTSQVTAVVSSNTSPNNTASPAISGTAKVGEQLTADPGTWTGGVRSYAYQWQRCNSSGGSCSAVQDATAKAYGVGTADSGNTLRVVVTATNLAGTATATSAPTATVTSGAATPPPVVRRANRAPTIAFVGLKRLGTRLYARFRVCDDSSAAVTVVERDLMPGRLAYTRRFSVTPVPCGTHTRSWHLIGRFQHFGRFTSTLRAIDKSGASSRTTSRSLNFHGAL